MKLIYPCPKKLKYELGSIKKVNIYRKIDCALYDICLEKTAILNYESFSCVNCTMYIQTKIEAENDKYKQIIKEILNGDL